MSGRGKNRRSLVKGVLFAFCAFLFVLAPFDYRSFFESVPIVRGDETISGTVHWSGDKLVTGQVVVPGDATLIIDRGTTVSFASGANILVHGTLEVKGTVKDKVIFQGKDGEKTGYVVGIAGGTADIRNADISGGGGSYGFGAFSMIHRTPLLRAEAMHMAPPPMRYGAVYCNSVCHLNIEGARFHDNDVAISMLSPDVFSQVFVNRSRFIDNGFDVDGAGGTGDFRYDWWGNTNGPQKICGGCADYDKIAGNIDFSDFATTEYFRDPVIVIPGILGSEKKDGKLVLDPIFGTYDNLVATLKRNGYMEGVDLFLFPYDWLASNVDTAKLLKTKIEEIQAKEHWPKVDAVAHSMGGLVAREYIEMLGGANNIDQFITLGTPHNGASEDYLTWEGGEIYDSLLIKKLLINKILKQFSEEMGYENSFDFIRKAPVESVRELLPVYDYLRDKDSGKLRSYPDKYPTNPFLEKLNDNVRLQALENIDFTDIVGKKGNDTITTLRVGGQSIELLGDADKAVQWGHGEPDGYDATLPRRGSRPRARGR